MKSSLPQPRRFLLVRDVDTTGMSGTGVVAHGTKWHDGTASVLWLPPYPSVVFWYRSPEGMSDAEWIHTHGGTTNTRIEWLDPGFESDKPDTVTIPLLAFSALVKVAQYVSVGKSLVGSQGKSYPDAKARRALGYLDDVGLLPTTRRENT